MKLSLNNLYLKNFLSYQNAGVVLPTSGMILLQGPSGAGKSAIMQGIAYAFGYNSTPAGKLTTWDSAIGASAEVAFEIGDFRCFLDRKADGPASLLIQHPYDENPPPDEMVKGNSSVNDRLKQLFGISPEFLSELTYRPQQEPGSFVRKTDAEKKEFLTEVLGLHKFEEAVKKAKERLNTLEIEEALAGNKLTYTQDAILAAEAEIQKYPKPPTPDPSFSDRVDDAKREVDLMNEQWGLARFRLSQAKPAEDNEGIKAHKELLAGLEAMRLVEDKVVAETSQDYQGWGKVAFKLQNLLKKKAKLETGTCFECGQDWTNEAQMEQVVEEIKTTEVQDAKCKEAIRRYNEAKETIGKLGQAISDLRGEIEEKVKANDVEYRNLAVALNEATNNKAHSVALWEKAKHDLELVWEKYKKAQDLHTAALNRKATAQTTYEGVLVNLDSITKEIHKENDFTALTGNQGFLGAIFEEVLIQIASEANSILAQVPNTAHVAVAFNEHVTASGKKSIVLDVTVNGNETTLQAGLSGGMKTVVMLATDLAVAKVVAQRSGLNPNWLILDEPFDGLDSSSREAMLELLAKEAQEKVIIVVDHSVDTSGMFQRVLKVSQENGISTVDTMK